MDGDVYEKLIAQTWEILNNHSQSNADVWRHFFGVAMLCAFLGLKRDLDVEVCKAAGLLHDLWLFLNFPLDRDMHRKHGYIGSKLSKEILTKNGGYSEEQNQLICEMIYNHNDKDIIQDVYSETLKDADSLEHFLNNSGYDKKYNFHGREKKIFEEFMITENL